MAESVDPNGLQAIDALRRGDAFPEIPLNPTQIKEVFDCLMIQVAKFTTIENPASSPDQIAQAQADLAELREQQPETTTLAFLARRVAAARLQRSQAA